MAYAAVQQRHAAARRAHHEELFMKVFQVEGEWSMDHLRLGTRPEPQAGPGQVRLRMQAAALNYRDLLVPQRGYGARMQALPLVMLSDGVGVVDQVGPGVTLARLGERLCPLLFQTWAGGPPDAHKLSRGLGCETDGTMAEYLVLHEAGTAPAPANLSEVEAASLPTAGLTAWRAVVTEGQVRPGDVVLVQGTGGVALFSLQFAKLLGAHVICTSSSDAKLERVRALGADAVINYRTKPDWGRAAKEMARALSGRDGADLVIELGGEDSLAQSLRAARAGGTLAMIGVLGGATMNAPLGLVVTRAVRLQGITVGSRDDFLAMSRAIESSGLKPVIDRVFAFEELRPALDYLRSGQHFGKVCIRH
jgi:NADPH:quinone reductase-like Zn-dependent oxidoreductase